MRINTNVASLNAQTNAQQTNKSLQSSLEKLSSGLQINKAADDASGMAIADKLRTQASSIGQGISNANSASALIQIADKAMSEQSSILDTVKTKLIQASTSTTSAEGREAIRKDVSKLLEQMDNISAQTNYNGINLLNEKGAEFSFQVGEDESFDIGLSTAYAVNTAGLGSGETQAHDEDSLIAFDNAAGVSIGKIGTEISVQRDPSKAISSGTSSAVVQINGAVANENYGTSGYATVEIDATNVSGLTLDVSGAAAFQQAVTFTTSDKALQSELASNTNFTKISDEVYQLGGTTNSTSIEFSSKIDISDLKISGLYSGSSTLANNDRIGVITNDHVDIKKIDGPGEVTVRSGHMADSMLGGNTAVTVDTNLVGKNSSSADGFVYEDAAGPLIKEGTVAVKVDSTVAVPADHKAAIGINNTDANENATVTVNAEKVTGIKFTAGAADEKVSLATNDASTMAALDEMAANNGALTKISNGSYQFDSGASQSAVLTFSSEVNLKDLTIANLDNGQNVFIRTDEAVSVSNDIEGQDGVRLSSNDWDDASGATAALGNLVGSSVNATEYSETLASLKDLGEGELTTDMANNFMSVIDNAMTQLNSVRADFGSTQNQLDVATRNMMVTKVNIQAAESVIRDVDYASESANFNKQNIIAQAGTYAMSQANAMQQNVMRLLQ